MTSSLPTLFTRDWARFFSSFPDADKNKSVGILNLDPYAYWCRIELDKASHSDPRAQLFLGLAPRTQKIYGESMMFLNSFFFSSTANQRNLQRIHSALPSPTSATSSSLSSGKLVSTLAILKSPLSSIHLPK